MAKGELSSKYLYKSHANLASRLTSTENYLQGWKTLLHEFSSTRKLCVQLQSQARRRWDGMASIGSSTFQPTSSAAKSATIAIKVCYHGPALTSQRWDPKLAYVLSMPVAVKDINSSFQVPWMRSMVQATLTSHRLLQARAAGQDLSLPPLPIDVGLLRHRE